MSTDAASPRDIPSAGWRAIARRVWRLQSEAGLWVAAAGVAFHAVLGILPGLGVLVLTIGTTVGINVREGVPGRWRGACGTNGSAHRMLA